MLWPRGLFLKLDSYCDAKTSQSVLQQNCPFSSFHQAPLTPGAYPSCFFCLGCFFTLLIYSLVSHYHSAVLLPLGQFHGDS